MYKSLEDVKLVIELKKPLEVIEAFIASYLQGLAYEAWKDGKDLTATEEVVVGQDEAGNDIIETKLVYVYEEVGVDVEAWKKENYAILRKAFYPQMADYMDAVVKGDTEAQQSYIEACLAVKERFPK